LKQKQYEVSKDEYEDVFVAKSLKLMNYLIMNGYPCIKVRDDDYNKQFKVFYFKWSRDLQKLANDFIRKNY